MGTDETCGWRRRKADRPREILAAARAVISEKGCDYSVVEIARRAGISKGTIYLYFRDKDQLYKLATAPADVAEMPELTAMLP